MRLFLLLGCMLVFGCSTTGKQLTQQASASDNKAQVQLLKHHYELGESYYKNNQLEMAQAEFEQMLVIRPEEEFALYRLGNIAFKKREFDLSANYFERTIKANPKNKKAHYNLASLRLMQAENHFKYYAALADKDTDLSKVSKLVADIDDFNTRKSQTKNSTNGTLDTLAGALKR